VAQDTVLQIVRDACNEIGITAPNTAVSATDLQIVQLTALVTRDGRELAGRCQWTALNREATFTSVAAEDQGTLVGTIVASTAGLKYIINNTLWDRSTKYPLNGPASGRTWQAEKAFGITGPYARYRIQGNHLYLLPAPEAGLTLSFEYQSENWVSSSDGLTFRSRFTQDEDFPLLDSSLLTMGAIWRWKKAKGLEYSQDFEDYESAVADAMARDGTKPIISLNGDCNSNFQPFVVVPLTNFLPSA
jgi:hypothetical protein